MGSQRPRASGKFLYVGREKFYVKGVTYGAFRPDANGREYHDSEQIETDFALMAAHGVNTVRVPHTMPPPALLDAAQRHGLRVMVGLSAEQYVGYLMDGTGGPHVPTLVRDKVRRVAGHPALLCYAIGNEIPAPVARWLGRRRLERYLQQMYRVIKSEDPEGIVTYVNYPTTEYLDLPFLDAVSFNVYLELPDTLKAYVARLQNIAGDRPLIMSELGLDALRNGEALQAQVLDWQVRTSFAASCAGVIIFSWTDEWHRAGAEVDDWAFGLTDRQRQPKAALTVVQQAFEEVPLAPPLHASRFSVIVCSYNGARTIDDCLTALARLRYPNYEVIVVNDGSTDATPEIVGKYDVRLITTENRGLSQARNVGLQAATGEFVAYLDDDAFPDEQWLDYLAATFHSTAHVGIGGPNVPPPGDGWVADCVANAPGGPVHVLLSDELAEHIPGCNMAFRKSALQAIGGFDPQFRSAGDDVDLCWRLQQQGGTLGYCPGAMVWHHRRNSVRAYWRQQQGYGRAEAMLEAKWPEKYNSAGHHTFAGRIYGTGLASLFARTARVYHGIWGTAPFQSLYQPAQSLWHSLSLMPEWYLLLLALAPLSVLAHWYRPMSLVAALAVGMGIWSVLQAARNARQTSLCRPQLSGPLLWRMQLLMFGLHLLQPLARLWGRLRGGLTIWRRRGAPGFRVPFPREFACWTDMWVSPENRLEAIDRSLRLERNVVLRGDEFARWDLEVRGGFFGAARLLMAVEDHGAGNQYVRVRAWPRWRRAGAVGILCGVVTLGALWDGAWPAAAVLGLGFAWSAICTVQQSGSALASLLRVAEPLAGAGD